MNAIGSALFPTDGYALAERPAFRPLAGTPETEKDSVAPTSEGAPASGAASSDGRPGGDSTAPASRSGSSPPSRSSRPKTPGVLSASDQAVVAELRRVDLQVRSHEMAHMSAGAGVVTGGPSYTYQRGPDGGRYAVAGEVPIAFTPDPRDPAATLQKAEQVQRAALAPAQPSSQDRAVAAAAAAVAADARARLAQERAQALQEGAGTSSSGEDSTSRVQAPDQSPGTTGATESGDPTGRAWAPDQSPGTTGATESGDPTGRAWAPGQSPGTTGTTDGGNRKGRTQAPGQSPGTANATGDADPAARDRRGPVDVRV